MAILAGVLSLTAYGLLMWRIGRWLLNRRFSLFAFTFLTLYPGFFAGLAPLLVLEDPSRWQVIAAMVSAGVMWVTGLILFAIRTGEAIGDSSGS